MYGKLREPCKDTVDIVESKLTERGEEPLRREEPGGFLGASGLFLLLFTYLCPGRDFYKLERLWADAAEIDIADII